MAVEENKDDFKQIFLQFANRDLPAFVEVKGKQWIYYGEKNDYPYYLIDLYTQSSIHKAIVDEKVDYICSNGWYVDTRGMNEADKTRANAMLENPFGLEDLTEATSRWAQDLEIFNGVCVLVHWDNGRKGGTLKYIDMANVRTNADQTEFYYTSKWYILNKDGSRKMNNKPEQEKDFKTYQAYNPNNRSGVQLYYWKFPHPNQAVYPLPVYQGAVTPINIDVSLDEYFFHTVENAFVPTHMLNFFNGEPSQEKANAIEQRIKDKWTKPGGSRIIVNFANNKETASEIHTIQMTDADKQYESISKRAEQGIITGHRLTSGMLIGIYREGTLGGRTELAFAEEHFQNKYVSARQQILEKIINKLAKDFGVKATFKLNRVRRVGLSFSEEIVKSALRPEEIRTIVLEQYGIKPSLLSEMKPVVQQFSDDDPYLKIAREYPEHELMFEECVEDFTREGIEGAELKLRTMAFAENMNTNSLEATIIDLLSKDPTTQPEEIAKIAGTSVEKVNKAIKSLVNRKVLSPYSIGEREGTAHEVTKKGDEVKEENKPAKTAKTEVVYRYGLAPKFKNEDMLLPTSHEFCVKRVKESESGKRWKSEDLWQMENDFPGMNAWLNRGGWYTEKDGTHVPQCRHAWYRQLIKIEQ